MAAIVLFYMPSAKTTKAIFEEYAGELSLDEIRQNDCKTQRTQVRPFDFFTSPPV